MEARQRAAWPKVAAAAGTGTGTGPGSRRRNSTPQTMEALIRPTNADAATGGCPVSRP
jgi:hypothetical protein